jgi:hypothetical protein
MINRIYVTSEEVDLVKEILEENKIEENVLKTLVFCKYYDLEIKSEVISNFEYEFDEIIYESDGIDYNYNSLRFIDDESDDYFDALDYYYDDVLNNELNGVSEIIKESINYNVLSELVREKYNDFDENGSLEAIYLYIDGYFEETYYIE